MTTTKMFMTKKKAKMIADAMSQKAAEFYRRSSYPEAGVQYYQAGRAWSRAKILDQAAEGMEESHEVLHGISLCLCSCGKLAFRRKTSNTNVSMSTSKISCVCSDSKVDLFFRKQAVICIIKLR